MKSQHVIEIDSSTSGMIYLSDMALTYDSKSYLAKITPESFDTLKTYSDQSTTFKFSVIDPPTVTYARTDFKDQTLIYRLLLDGVESQAFKLKIHSAVYNVGVWECEAKGLLGDVYTGTLPKTKHPNALFPDDNVSLDDLDDYRFPVVFGTAYIPIMTVCPVGDYGYLIGLTGPTYTVTEVTTPHDYPGGKTAYPVGAENEDDPPIILYPHSQATVTVDSVDYRIYKPLLKDTSDPLDGIGDDLGLFSSAGSLYPPLVEFSTSGTGGTSTFTGLEDVIELVLEHCGVDSDDIDTGTGSTFESVGSICSTRGIEVNGGFWEVESCQSAIESLLAHGDLFLHEGEKIELHAFSATSTETFTLSDTVDESFSVSQRTIVVADGGIVNWVEDGKPQDKFNGSATIGCYDSQTDIDNPDGTFTARFFSDSQLAQTAGMLKFAKEYLIEDDVSFESPYSKISTISTIMPNKVIRINDTLFGDYLIIIEIINFKQFSAVISGVRLEYLEDWDDITSDSVSILNYTPIGFVAEDIGAGTSFGTGYDPSDKVDEVGGTYASAASGAMVQLLPDGTNGLVILDDDSNTVFKAVVSGADVGDLVFGDYDNDQGFKYDKSANITDFKGTITTATIESGGSVTVNYGGDLNLVGGDIIHDTHFVHPTYYYPADIWKFNGAEIATVQTDQYAFIIDTTENDKNFTVNTETFFVSALAGGSIYTGISNAFTIYGDSTLTIAVTTKVEVKSVNPKFDLWNTVDSDIDGASASYLRFQRNANWPNDGDPTTMVELVADHEGALEDHKGRLKVNINTGAEGNSPSLHTIFELANGITIEDGILSLKETTTPSAIAGYVKLYSKADNKLYFQDGAGVEHEIQLVSASEEVTFDGDDVTFDGDDVEW